MYNDWWKPKVNSFWTWLLLIAAVCLILLSGCTATHILYVPSGKAVRLREPVYAAIWALDSNGKPVPGYMTLPAGWYALPRPQPKDSE